MKTQIGKILCIVFPWIVLSSCNKDDQNIVPSYFHVEGFDLVIDSPEVYGAGTQAIEDIWVLTEQDAIGVFQLPQVIPVLEEGNKKFVFKAGIKENGISNTRVPYPFYAPVEVNLDLKKERIDSLGVIPVTYTMETDFLLVEGFENPGTIQVENRQQTGIPYSITTNSSEVLTGSASLKAVLNIKTDVFDIAVGKPRTFTLSNPVYMELDFNTQIKLITGLIVHVGTEKFLLDKLILNETGDQWKKIYINYTRNIMRYPEGTRFQFFIGAVKTDDDGPQKILLDNIKVLHFE